MAALVGRAFYANFIRCHAAASVVYEHTFAPIYTMLYREEGDIHFLIQEAMVFYFIYADAQNFIILP